MLKKLVNKFVEWINPIKLPEGELPKIDTLKELENFRYVEEQTEQLCRMLKCQPNEILTRLNKVLSHIEQLDLEKRELEAKQEQAERPIAENK